MYTYEFTNANFPNAQKIVVSEIQDAIIELNITNLSTIIRIDSITIDGVKTLHMFFTNELNSNDLSLLTTLFNNYTDLPVGTICSIKDIKPAGTNGGTFEKNTWKTRTLNVVEGDVPFLSLSNNIVTINPGTYIIIVRAPACEVKNNQIRLRNITENTYTLGTSSYSSAGNMNASELHDTFTFTVKTNFDIQHICSDKINNIGFGRASGNNTNEVYTTVFIQKID